MVDNVQVVQAARHNTNVTVEIGLAAQIVKVSYLPSFFLDASGILCKVTENTAPHINQLSKNHLL